ncbi:MAG: sugar ABC transporter substrate-binding protein [Firmicutes bacterium]|nr:sugar ABC transporter substrate-binding protein [Bacillota bacterium]
MKNSRIFNGFTRIRVLAITCLLATTILGIIGFYTAEAAPKAQITWLCPGDFTVQKAHQKIVDEFNKRFPDIRVNYQHVTVGADYMPKLQTMIAGGSAPDIFQIDPWYFAGLVRKGGLSNLQPYADKTKGFDEGDFFPNSLAGFKYKGDIYGIPREGGPSLLAFNKDLFKAAGLKPPTDSWTWTDLLNAARKLTKRDASGRVTQYGFQWGHWAEWVWSNGGDILSHDNKECVLDQAPAVEALQWLADLIHKEKVAPPVEALTEQNPIEMFMMGRLATLVTVRSFWYRLKDVRFEWGMELLPKGKAGRVPVLNANALCVSSSSKHPEAAWTFINWALGVDGWNIRFEAAQQAGVPQRLSVTASEGYLSNGNPWLSRVTNQKIVKGVYEARFLPLIPAWSEIERTITPELDLLWSGKATAKEAVSRIKPAVDAILKKQ